MSSEPGEETLGRVHARFLLPVAERVYVYLLNGCNHVREGVEHRRIFFPLVCRKFFVGGVYPQATELQIRSYFERFGKVKEVELKMDKVTGRNRGFAFVTMSDAAGRDAVFKGQHMIGGKRIEVRALHDDGHAALKRKIFVGGVNPSLSEGRPR